MVLKDLPNHIIIILGILVELFYPGAPMGKLHGPDGQFTGPMNWQHATMYFFFGLSGAADILSHTAKHILPGGRYFAFKLLTWLASYLINYFNKS